MLRKGGAGGRGPCRGCRCRAVTGVVSFGRRWDERRETGERTRTQIFGARAMYSWLGRPVCTRSEGLRPNRAAVRALDVPNLRARTPAEILGKLEDGAAQQHVRMRRLPGWACRTRTQKCRFTKRWA